MVADHNPDFQQVYDEFQPRILRYLARLTGPHEAEDLSQEVFVKVSQALPSFRGESQLSTWIYRIATNATLDRLRSPAFRQIVTADSLNSENADQDDQARGDGPSPEQQLARKEMDECGLGLINQLPEGYRAVLVLSDLEGLSSSEIALILGITPGNVKIRLHRARTRLRDAVRARCDSYWFEDNEFVPNLKKSLR
jgi:RNA polymerase sigma-70 factor (ECF subfamily)